MKTLTTILTVSAITFLASCASSASPLPKLNDKVSSVGAEYEKSEQKTERYLLLTVTPEATAPPALVSTSNNVCNMQWWNGNAGISTTLLCRSIPVQLYDRGVVVRQVTDYPE
jgi:hypothetical protein